MSELPKGWTFAKLSDITRVNPRHPVNLPDDIPVSFVPMPSVRDDSPELELDRERPLGEVRTGFTHFAEGDVLFAKITPCMENGKGAIARGLTNALGCGTTELHILRPAEGISPDYLYHFVHQKSFRLAAKAAFTGSAGQARVPVSFLNEASLPLPPSYEQHRIVAKLDTLLDRVRVAEKRLDATVKILKRFRQAVLASGCSGQLTADWRPRTSTKGPEDLPTGWRAVCVGDVIEDLKYGTAQKCSHERRGTPVLRIPNVANGIIDLSDLKYAVLPPKERDTLQLVPGDILIIRSNGSVSLVGRCALVRKEEKGFAYAGYLIRIRPNQTVVLPGFLSLVLGSYGVRLQIELQARSTSGVNNINSEEVRVLHFLLPPLEEQHVIIRRVQAMFALADRLEARLKKSTAQVEQLTQSILAKAFRGELVTTEAELAAAEGRNFESAEQLLQSIQKREDVPTATPKSKTSKRPSTRVARG